MASIPVITRFIVRSAHAKTSNRLFSGESIHLPCGCQHPPPPPLASPRNHTQHRRGGGGVLLGVKKSVLIAVRTSRHCLFKKTPLRASHFTHLTSAVPLLTPSVGTLSTPLFLLQ
jgi:hypothetical protein